MRFSAGNQVGGPRLAWPILALAFWLPWPTLVLFGAVQNVCCSLTQSTCTCVLLTTSWMQSHITGIFLCAWGLNFYDEYVEMFRFPKRHILWPFGTLSIQIACLWDMCNSNLSTLPIALQYLDKLVWRLEATCIMQAPEPHSGFPATKPTAPSEM